MLFTTTTVPTESTVAQQGGSAPGQVEVSRRARLHATGLAVLLLAAGGTVSASVSAAGQSHTPAPSQAKRADGTLTVGPGPVLTPLSERRYQIELRLTPNRATLPGTITVKLLKRGRSVNSARIKLTFTMLDMDMGQLSGLLPQTTPGTYTHAGPLLGMGGHWKLLIDITPLKQAPLSVAVIDRIGE